MTEKPEFTPAVVTLVQYPNGGWIIQLGRLGTELAFGPDGTSRPAQVGAYSDSASMIGALIDLVAKNDNPIVKVDASKGLA